MSRPLPSAILMVDEKHRDQSLAAVSVLPRGAAVLLRDYHNPERHRLARGLLKLCRRRGLRLLLAAASREDVRFALRLGAHGLHFPQAALHAPARMMWGRRLFPRHWILSVSTHSRAAMIKASREGFDAVLLSPVFATTSHPGRRPLGPVRFSLLTREAALPVFALGGIHAGNVRRLVHGGAAGIAAIEGFALERAALERRRPREGCNPAAFALSEGCGNIPAAGRDVVAFMPLPIYDPACGPGAPGNGRGKKASSPFWNVFIHVYREWAGSQDDAL